MSSVITSLRGPRVFGLAIFDITMASLGMVIIFLIARSYWYPRHSLWPFIIIALLVMFPIAIFTHVLFGINTELNYKLGLSDNPKITQR